jgi:hypothetical protein
MKCQRLHAHRMTAAKQQQTFDERQTLHCIAFAMFGTSAEHAAPCRRKVLRTRRRSANMHIANNKFCKFTVGSNKNTGGRQSTNSMLCEIKIKLLAMQNAHVHTLLFSLIIEMKCNQHKTRTAVNSFVACSFNALPSAWRPIARNAVDRSVVVRLRKNKRRSRRTSTNAFAPNRKCAYGKNKNNKIKTIK